MRGIVAVSLILMGCGIAQSKERKKVANCTVEETEEGAVITCPDGSTAVISNGTEGVPGEVGATGEKGEKGSVLVDCLIKGE